MKHFTSAASALLTLILAILLVPVSYAASYVDSTLADTGFSDVPQSAYYASAVKWALESGVTTGTSATTFSPNATCARGQVVTFLWRTNGSPEPKTARNPFADVKASQYWYKPILWAVENGVTNGTSATAFSPDQTCSRAHIVTFLYRASGSPDKTGTGQWYDDAVRWARSGDLLSGTAQTFTPGANCPRADVVTYLYRSSGANGNGASKTEYTAVPDGQGKIGKLSLCVPEDEDSGYWFDLEPSTGIWTGEQEPRQYGFLVNSEADVLAAIQSTISRHPKSMTFFTRSDPEFLSKTTISARQGRGMVGEALTGYEHIYGLLGWRMQFHMLWPAGTKNQTKLTRGDYAEMRIDFCYDAIGVVQAYRSGVIDALPDKEDVLAFAEPADYGPLYRALETIESTYGLTASSSDYDKVYAIHCYLTQNFTYDYVLKDVVGRDAYYAKAGIAIPTDINYLLKTCSGVCDNFAITYQALCACLGVEAYFIASGDHAWNLVNIGGQWYQADATWDIHHKPGQFAYFLLSDAAMAKDIHHVPREEFYEEKNLPRCPESYAHPNDAAHPATGGTTGNTGNTGTIGNAGSNGTIENTGNSETIGNEYDNRVTVENGMTTTYYYATRFSETPIPEDGRLTHYREEYTTRVSDEYWDLSVRGNTLTFTGYRSPLDESYNYAVLWVLDDKAYEPVAGESFTLSITVDLDQLRECPDQTSGILAMLAENCTPGDTSFAGMGFYSQREFLLGLDETGNLVLILRQ